MVELSDIDLMSILSDEGQSSSSIVMIYEQDDLEQPVRFKQILSRIAKKIRHYPEFRYRVTPSLLPYAVPNWSEDNNFDIEYHIRHVALPKPGDWRQFSILVARLHSRPLAMNRSLWDVYVIEGLDNMAGITEGSFAVIIKTHNVLSKHAGIKRLLKDLHDNEEGAPRLLRHAKKSQKSSFPIKLLKTIARSHSSIPLAASARLSNFLQSTIIREFSPYLRAIFARSDFIYSRFNTNISNYRSWTSQDLLVSDINAITKALPQVIRNDVMVAIIAGALKAYLKDKRELPTDTDKDWTIKVKNDLLDEWADKKVNPNDYLPVTLSMSVDDPKTCLLSVANQRITSKRVSSASEPDFWTSIPVVKSMLMAVDLKNISRHFSHLVNTTINSIHLPTEQLSMCGAKMVSISSVAPIYDGMGLNHSINEYNGRIIISVTSCREMLPDASFYNQCLRESCSALLDSISVSAANLSAA
jgi:diacylglycerol O-acyltransferase